jgi:hypothetical protein
MNKNIKKLLFFPILIVFGYLYAQSPEDALHYSFYPQNATARILAVGGADGSLGGDISSTFINPAGLGQYRTSEFVITPGFSLNSNSNDFRGTNNKNTRNSFGVGPIGFVFGFGDSKSTTTSHALSIAFTQSANFNNNVHYSGYNNHSSFAEQWAEEYINSGDTSIHEALNDPSLAYGTALALNNYLVDTFIYAGPDTVLKAMPEFVLANGTALRQENSIVTKGGIYELALAYATNKNDKVLIGGTLGIPIVNYQYTGTFIETDTSSNTNNNFSSFTYTDERRITGAGVNLKAGIIFKPREYIRIGFAIHTPTFFSALKEQRSTFLTSDEEQHNSLATISSDYFNNGPGVTYYNLFTPLKMMISGSYVFRETEDITKQRAFVTADIEFVNNHGSIYSDANDVSSPMEQAAAHNYYHGLNNVIKSQYKGTFNFRAGGELKFNTIMGRLGFAYYGNPYKDPALSASSTLLSGGVGYRDKGIFIDLTYVHALNKDVNFPYRLQDKSNTFATTQNTRGNIVLSFGIKL